MRLFGSIAKGIPDVYILGCANSERHRTAVCTVGTHLNTVDMGWRSVQKQQQTFTRNYPIPSLLMNYTGRHVSPGLTSIIVSSNQS